MKKETLQEFLARGGKVTKCPPSRQEEGETYNYLKVEDYIKMMREYPDLREYCESRIRWIMESRRIK